MAMVLRAPCLQDDGPTLIANLTLVFSRAEYEFATVNKAGNPNSICNLELERQIDFRNYMSNFHRLKLYIRHRQYLKITE